MSSEILMELMEKADLLTLEEQLHLIESLAEKARVATVSQSKRGLKWSDLKGLLPYPACGEDAQTHISRSRREADENRSISPVR